MHGEPVLVTEKAIDAIADAAIIPHYAQNPNWVGRFNVSCKTAALMGIPPLSDTWGPAKALRKVEFMLGLQFLIRLSG
jgi:hypothetical protein